MYYSGKKKRHTAVKTQFMVNNCGYVIHKTNHKRGCRHDYNIYKITILSLPNKLLMPLILGYLGIEKDFPEAIIIHTSKKKEKP